VRIISGQLSPGHVLDGEIEASARLRVSRPPVIGFWPR
jgi:DNA-binding FadR family transcriptional regulator